MGLRKHCLPCSATGRSNRREADQLCASWIPPLITCVLLDLGYGFRDTEYGLQVSLSQKFIPILQFLMIKGEVKTRVMLERQTTPKVSKCTLNFFLLPVDSELVISS